MFESQGCYTRQTGRLHTGGTGSTSTYQPDPGLRIIEWKPDYGLNKTKHLARSSQKNRIAIH